MNIPKFKIFLGLGAVIFLSACSDDLTQMRNSLKACESIKNIAEGNLDALAKRHKSEIEEMKKDYENEVAELNKELKNVTAERDVFQNKLSQYINASARMYQN